MPKYRPWLGILIWILGSVLGIVLALYGVIERKDSALLVWVFFAIPIFWSCTARDNEQ